MVCRSAPASSRCVAKQWRSTWGYTLLLNPGTAGGILAGVARGLGIDGLITAVPAIAGKQPDAGFFAQAPPVRAEFVEQDGAEHYVAVLATLAALDVNHHASAIDVADLQASQLGVANAGGVEGHEDGAIEGCRRGIDELRYFFLTENGGQAVALSWDRECRQCSTASSASGCRKTAGHTDGWSPNRATASAR